ncbi:MAG TPA: alpha-2-macroglobulin family protein [Pyrinomonadaceae bacterium]|nr:alpha-2-macroglobulin family protein [Pyrinomonadaceae bacterium]
MKSLKGILVLLLLFQFVLGPFAPLALRTYATSMKDDAEKTADADAGDAPVETTPKGLRFHLSEGAEQSGKTAPRPVVVATKLSESETARVLQRLPPLKEEASDEQEFALREKSLPPPRAGATVLNAFPAAGERKTPDEARGGELQILRYSPQGNVPLAPQVSLTFSQPMVAVTSQEEAAQTAPVALSPKPAGRWRWLGTKTLIFDPDGQRLPMATEFTVTVPSGTRSAVGGVTKTPVVWKFSTPPPKLVQKYPENVPARRDSIIFMEFDQRVELDAVLRALRVRSGAGLLKVRLASVDEINADEKVKALVKDAVKGRWLALRAVDESGGVRDALPSDSAVSVTVNPGTPSAEGPRTTTVPQEFSFRTYGALRVADHQCGWNKSCTPFDQWRIEFSNPLDAEAFDQAQVKIEPEVPDAKVVIYGQTVYVGGAKRGRTTYKVTLDRSLRDTFGQTLAAPVSITFNVGPAPPSLTSAGGNFIVLEPAGEPRLSVYSVNQPSLKVSLYAVGAEDFDRYVAYMKGIYGYYDARQKQKQTAPPGTLISTKTVQPAARPDEMTETRIDLAPALKDGRGNVFVVVEPATHRQDREILRTWVQVTSIGLDAFVDRDELVGWATSLADGQPLEGVEMTLKDSRARGVSGADGLARLQLPPKSDATTGLLIARKGGDTAFLPERADWWSNQTGWVRRDAQDELRWYVFDDRKMYRPGEEVSVKGWIRRVGAGRGGDVGALAGAADTVSYTVRDSRGNEVTKGTARLNATGGFDTKFKLPATMNLGYSSLQLQAEGGSGITTSRQFQHQFQVQEFRRPEFEVNAQSSEGPHFVGGHAQATVQASYYAGGGLVNSEVNWRVTATPGQFTPPNRGDYTFGKWTPWWESYNSSSNSSNDNTQTFKGTTDAAGKHILKIDFDSVNPPQPSTVTAEASVTDVNRQVWTSTTTMLVHPSELYVGLKSERLFVQQGEPLVVAAIVTDIDGRAVAGREVQMRAALLDWKQVKGEWKQVESKPEECALKSANDEVKCTFHPKAGGVYRVTARVLDDRERANESELTLWVAGGKQPPQRGVEQQKAELIPDRKEYRAGDTAEILVQSPFIPAEGVLTLRRSGLVRTERFRMSEPSYTLKIPIEEAFTPNVYAQVDLVGAMARTNERGETDEKLPKRPAFATGSLNLSVPPLARRLQVTATPRDKALEPGGETTVAVEVRDAAGHPVEGSELAVVVVDESVLALTGYKLEDPVAVFYAQRGADVSDYHLRNHVQLAGPGDITIAEGRGAGGGRVAFSAGVSNADAALMPSAMAVPAPVERRAIPSLDKLGTLNQPAEQQAIRLRENFNALAVFAPSLPTDAQGRAEVKVKVPDNLTRYRVMAVSVVGGRQFGSGESSITARQPLMVRPSAPRFLNFGDRFELPVVVQNQTDKPIEAEVAVRASNVEFTDGQGRRVNVPANDRVEVRFPTSASKAGTARFQVGAVSGRFNDAAQVELPVWTPATTEAFATYGELDASGALVQPVKAPPDVFKQFGGLEVQTSSTQLQALTDAVLYLVAYPFECSEQLSSRVLAVAALRDVLTAFKAKDMPKPEEMKVAVARDIKRLQGMQNEDGGFAFWRRGDESWPYVSIHAAHALARAREKGYDVPQGMLDKSRSYLKEIESHIPHYYSRDARGALIAYALYVRNHLGDRDAARARRLVTNEGLDKLSLEAVGWLLPVLSGDPASTAEVALIRRLLNNRAEETAGTAHFTTGYGDGDYLLLHSDRRADAVILEALITDQPASDLIPKIVRGLLAHRTRGRWENTQENAFVLLALDRYFQTYEKATPDFVARAWLGDAYAGEQQFRGRSTDRQQFDVPMRYLADHGGGSQNLTLQKEGAGRLYYRIGMQYAPNSLKLAPADYGFTVERVYEAIDDAKDVRRDSEGTWHIRAGAKVRVRLTLVAPTRRYHVALTDPLPAGLEALNPALAVTGSIPEDQKAQPSNFGWWWVRPWFEHQNLRDERVEAFTSLLWEGVYSYSYVARATTPGAFVVPPPKAEEMYHPETFGRGATDRVAVE